MPVWPHRSLPGLARALAALLALLLALPLLYLLAACALMLWPAPGDPAPGAPEVEAYVTSNGVHTDLVLPLQAGEVDWRPVFAPAHARRAREDADFVAIGWGDREFYLNTPTWAELTPGRALGALLGRNPAALQVRWLRREELPPQHTWRLPLSAAQYRRLARHVHAALPGGQARPIAGAHPGMHGAFYAAAGRYHLLYTCNNWSAEGLRAAGLPVSRWAPLAFNVTWHLQPLAPQRR